ncbi:hypothetical protein FA13DRAFT_1817844 [Coprinellus micaceus]|uniref:Nephrocystin 3-like N-terminal domain-containing protein n=1 Tax=Coprinellus micaceus TaxID=71717 RepID=A0A4Y7STD4_COPMI|nr:hypothetical protein FA13DRAFT_1817844 [Coprinellus micaceus]
MPTPACRTNPKSKFVARGRRGKQPKDIEDFGEGEATPSGPSAIASNEHPPIARSTRSATKNRTAGTRERLPRPRSVVNPSRPDRGTSPPPAPRAGSTTRMRSHPYLPPSQKARSGKTSGRAQSTVIDGPDAIDGRRMKPLQAGLPGAGLQGTIRATNTTRIPSLVPHSSAHHSPSTPPASSSTPALRSPSPLALPHIAASPPRVGQPLYVNSTLAVTGTSYFPYSQNVNVGNLNNISGNPKALFDYLDPHICHGAAHNSAERCGAPQCREETRVAIRQDIISWIQYGDGDDEPKKVMWLSGPAGGGKTAIAGSVAVACREEGLLAATFFFSSFSPSVDRSSKRGFIITLAHHMSQHAALHQFKSHLLIAIQNQPDIFHKDLKDQAEHLILGPFRNIDDPGSGSQWPKVIIIDGLDEVAAAPHKGPTKQRILRTSEEEQVEILNVILALSQSPIFPFRIFVASRPERNITEFFDTHAGASTIRLFLDSKYEPDADIRLFLEANFGEIRRHAGITSPSWPGKLILDRLVDMSSGQFIVPVTIIRWVKSGIPQRQLDAVLQLERVGVGKKNPFATLDALYRHILERANAPDDDAGLEVIIKWILTINSGFRKRSLSCAPYNISPPSPPPATFWRQFLEDEEGEFNYRLGPITSLLSVPLDDTPSPVTIYHKSLIDFLSSPTRCTDLYVDEEKCMSFISERILMVLKEKGPVVPLSSPADLATFLKTFFSLNVLSNECQFFLAFLSKASWAKLATCDAAWWTTVSLSALHCDGSGLPCSRNTHKPSGNDWGHHSYIAQGIYKAIHQSMECPSKASSSAQPGMRQDSSSLCHTACVRWRTGILATAKGLGWCIHRLEGVELDKLPGLSMDDLYMKFRDPLMRRHTCLVCQPVLASG